MRLANQFSNQYSIDKSASARWPLFPCENIGFVFRFFWSIEKFYSTLLSHAWPISNSARLISSDVCVELDLNLQWPTVYAYKAIFDEFDFFCYELIVWIEISPIFWCWSYETNVRLERKSFNFRNFSMIYDLDGFENHNQSSFSVVMSRDTEN